MTLEAVRGANGKRSTWPVPVSVPHKPCTAIDTLLTFTFCPSPPLPISVRSSGLTLVNDAIRCDAVTYHYSNRKHVSKKKAPHIWHTYNSARRPNQLSQKKFSHPNISVMSGSHTLGKQIPNGFRSKLKRLEISQNRKPERGEDGEGGERKRSDISSNQRMRRREFAPPELPEHPQLPPAECTV